MTILSTLGRIVTEFGAARSRYLTERAISALPTEVQKDIGWPDVSSRGAYAPGVGSWAGAK